MTTFKRNIFYIGEIDWRLGSASSARIINNARAIELTQRYSVTLVGKGQERFSSIEGFRVLNVKRGNATIEKVLFSLFRAYFIIKLLKKNFVFPDVIVYYGTSSIVLLPLKHYCRKNNIKIVVDVVEWYDYSHLPMGRLGPFALNVWFAMKKVIPSCDGLIVISSFLEDYFSRLTEKSIIRIPVLVDTNIKNFSIEVSKNDTIQLVYAGSPGKKDLLIDIVLAINELCNRYPFIYLKIIGVTDEYLKKRIDFKLSTNIKCYGKIPQNDVYHHLIDSDFSIFLRLNERYAFAGFPTKFVESLNYGLPVIANITSDLGEYLIDGYNGYIINGPSKDDLVEKLELIIEKETRLCDFKQGIFELKNNARNTALNSFNYSVYSDKFEFFFNNILM